MLPVASPVGLATWLCAESGIVGCMDELVEDAAAREQVAAESLFSLYPQSEEKLKRYVDILSNKCAEISLYRI